MTWQGYIAIGSITFNLKAFAGHASGQDTTERLSTHKRNLETGNEVVKTDVDKTTRQPCKDIVDCVKVARGDNRVLTRAMGQRLDSMLPNSIEVIGYLKNCDMPLATMYRSLYYLFPEDTQGDRTRYASLLRNLKHQDTADYLVAVAGWSSTQVLATITYYDDLLACHHLAWPENVRKPSDIGHLPEFDKRQDDPLVTEQLSQLAGTTINSQAIQGDFRQRSIDLIAYEAPSIGEVVQHYKQSNQPNSSKGQTSWQQRQQT